MPPLAADAIGTLEGLAVNHDPASHACAKDDSENCRVSLRGTEGRLRQGAAVGIVIDHDSASQRVREVGKEGLAVEAEGVGSVEESVLG